MSIYPNDEENTYHQSQQIRLDEDENTGFRGASRLFKVCKNIRVKLLSLNQVWVKFIEYRGHFVAEEAVDLGVRFNDINDGPAARVTVIFDG